MPCRTGLTFDPIRVREHLPNAGHTLTHRCPGAARPLDRQGLKERPSLEIHAFQEKIHIVEFAAQSSDQHACEIWVPGITRNRTLEDVETFRATPPARGPVAKGDHPIDMGKLSEPITPKGLSDITGHRGRAVHKGEHPNVVARGNATIWPHDAFEGRLRLFWHVIRGSNIGAHRVVASKRL